MADLLHAGDVALFVLAAAALVPLAWLIGEATEHAAGHTGPGIGGFLNASFGNAPELIIALLLVLGVALFAAGEGRLDRSSLIPQLGLVVAAVLVFLVPSVPGFHGDPERR